MDKDRWHSGSPAALHECHEEEAARRVWWDRRLLRGGPERESPSWLQRRRWLQRGLSGRRLETRAPLVMPSADHRLPGASAPFLRWFSLRSVEIGRGVCVKTWGLKLYRSSGRGCGLRSQADGTTTPIRIRSWTRCICTSGCSCCVSPSRCTWWVSVRWPSAPEGN